MKNVGNIFFVCLGVAISIIGSIGSMVAFNTLDTQKNIVVRVFQYYSDFYFVCLFVYFFFHIYNSQLISYELFELKKLNFKKELN